MEDLAKNSECPENSNRPLISLSRRLFLSSLAGTGMAAFLPARAFTGETVVPSAANAQARAALLPPAGQEASYDWYVRQYTDPSIFTPIGLPGDPAETVVSPNGELVYANDLITQGKRRGRWIPGTHYARNALSFAYDVCGPINLAFGGVLPRDDERIQHVIRWIIDKTHGGSVEEATAGVKEANEGAMFYSQDLAIVLLELGRVEDFLRIFYTLLASNISHQTLTTCEWRSNTQPHAHSIGSLIRMMRTMLIQERDGDLYLLQGTPRRWMAQDQVLKITKAPTWYGALSLEARSNVRAGKVTVHVDMPERIRDTRVHVRLRLPDGRSIKGALVNGREPTNVQGEWITLKGVAGTAEIVAQLA